MTGQGRPNKKAYQRRKSSDMHRDSISSALPGSQVFFDDTGAPQIPTGRHASTHVWKSEDVK